MTRRARSAAEAGNTDGVAADRSVCAGAMWSSRVTTLSTFPPAGLFARNVEVIAETKARPEVSPGGLGGASRMVTFFANRAGRNLPAARRAELDRAKQLLRERRAALEVVPATQHEAGRYRHLTLGAVAVRRRGGRWEMLRDGAPAIALGPDGLRYLERA
jgi:hypothetical protein